MKYMLFVLSSRLLAPYIRANIGHRSERAENAHCISDRGHFETLFTR